MVLIHTTATTTQKNHCREDNCSISGSHNSGQSTLLARNEMSIKSELYAGLVEHVRNFSLDAWDEAQNLVCHGMFHNPRMSLYTQGEAAYRDILDHLRQKANS